MSKKADQLLANILGNRWRASTVAAGVSGAATCPAAPDSQSRPHLETLWYSIKNWSAGAALQHTVGIQVRGAGNTVFMSVDHVLASSTVANATIQSAMIQGKRGGTLSLVNNTAIASVTYSLNAAGWFEDDNG